MKTDGQPINVLVSDQHIIKTIEKQIHELIWDPTDVKTIEANERQQLQKANTF